MQTTFKGTIVTQTNRWDKKYETIDRPETKEALEKFFKKNKIVQVAGPYRDADDKDYPFDITVMDESYNQRGKKFRVYFSNREGPKTFVQSDNEGEIDAKKLIEKATLAFTRYQRIGDQYRINESKSQVRAKMVEKLNKKLEGTGFKVDHDWGSIDIKARFHSNEEALEFAEKLIEALKK